MPMRQNRKLSSVLPQETFLIKKSCTLKHPGLEKGMKMQGFFHAVDNGGCNRNLISRLRDRTHLVENTDELGRVYTNLFWTYFGTKRDFCFKISQPTFLKKKHLTDLSPLELSFTKEEAKKATFDLGTEKAPGLDGFPLFFFQRYWNIMEYDLVNLCVGFYEESINLERINQASIALILKKDNPINLDNFWPISLINSSLKSYPNFLLQG